jgi:hypothetical protein
MFFCRRTEETGVLQQTYENSNLIGTMAEVITYMNSIILSVRHLG